MSKDGFTSMANVKERNKGVVMANNRRDNKVTGHPAEARRQSASGTSRQSVQVRNSRRADLEVPTGTRNSRGKKKMTKKQKRKRRLVMLGVEAFALCILLLGLYIANIVGKIDFRRGLSDEEAGINSDLDADTLARLENFQNIAIFGLDSRSANAYDSNNSDVIMIASIDKDTKDVRLVSVYRDTLMNIGNDKYRKANAAYSNGGAEAAVQMLNANLDLNITEYICVDWCAMVEAIDALGGVEIEVSDAEMSMINDFMWEIEDATGQTAPRLYQSGLVTLNGTQATSYARIRHLAGDDFMRTSRQRILLEAMLNKAKQSDIGTLTKICNNVFDDVATNIQLTDIIGMAADVMKYDVVGSTGFPFALTTRMLDTGDTVVPADLEYNVVTLHEFLFGVDDTTAADTNSTEESADNEYEVSDTVKSISQEIIYISGVDRNTEGLVDTTKYNDTTGSGGTGNINQGE